ncbi:MAG: hypothetical protein CMM03_17500 [Rhodopirellula sp.]|mgnify:CR=1 FL=1|nr:hypothetical protein [Rhodopirellula sp.]
MTMTQSRRQFISQTSQLAIASAALPGFLNANNVVDTPKYEIGLSQYSLRAMFKDRSLDPLDYAKFTVDTFGIKAVDLWEGGLAGDKLDNKNYLEKLRTSCDDAGTRLFLLMTGALDANPDKAAASRNRLLPSIDRAAALGTEYLRVFLKAPGEDEAAGVQASVDALKPLADAAAKKDVMIVIEPGASKLSQRGAFLAKVCKQLNHPALRLMPDFGKQVNNVYDGTEAMMPYTVTISCKMHSFDDNGKQPHFDYNRLLKIIDQADYRGFLTIEWEGSKLQPVPGVLASKKLIEQAIANLAK